jgi:hypothetical protein
VSEVLSFLLTNQSVATGDFVKDREATEAARDTMSRFVLIELATLPISASTAGFSYEFNPALGTMERRSDNFGPFFLERAITSGQGRTSIGATVRHSRFASFDGRPLRDGSLIITANKFADEAQPFDVERLALRIDASTFTVFATYGVTDRLDVGASVPIVRLGLAGERRNRYRGSEFLQARGVASAIGLADVALRAKYTVFHVEGTGLATALDLRLPTGREENLLGVGRTALRVSVTASHERARMAGHVMAGVARGGISNELSLGVAVVLSATPRFSLVGELAGRRLEALSRIGVASAPHPVSAGVETIRLAPIGTGANSLVTVAGFKWNITGGWLLNASVLVPVTETGLTARITPSIALDVMWDP